MGVHNWQNCTCPHRTTTPSDRATNHILEIGINDHENPVDPGGILQEWKLMFWSPVKWKQTSRDSHRNEEKLCKSPGTND